MQFPIDLVIGGARISSHFIFDVLAMLAGFQYYAYLKKRDRLSSDTRLSVGIGAIAGAVIGAKLLALASLSDANMFREFGITAFLLGGKTIVGALAGGIIGVEVAKFFAGEKQSTGDIYVYPLIVGMMLGRVGCFLTGVSDETVGLRSSLPWAFDQGDGIARHPTSLYEIVFLAVLFLIFKYAERFEFAAGIRFRIFVIAYFLFRFLVDFLKPGETIALHMSAIQWTALVFATWYAFDIYRTYASRKSRSQ